MKKWVLMWYGISSHLLSSTTPLIERLSEKVRMQYWRYILNIAG